VNRFVANVSGPDMQRSKEHFSMSGIAGPWYTSAQPPPAAISRSWAERFKLPAPMILGLIILELWCRAVLDADHKQAAENVSAGD
jgi:hypothetical protein